MVRYSKLLIRGIAGTVLAALAVFLLLMPASSRAQGWSGGDELPVWEQIAAQRQAVEDTIFASGPEVREPFFAFLTGLALGDSVGLWTGADIRAFSAGQGFTSKFPVEMVKQVVRRRPSPSEQISWPMTAVRAVWEIDLFEDLNRSLPYSILGYHPGSLKVSRKILLTETRGGSMAVHRGQEIFVVGNVIMLRLDQGHVILDVDGLVDRLLGKGLDDSATVGFVLAREEGQLIGLAVSLGRNGRKIYGEFDFRRDKVLPNGRPLAKALSAASRQRMLNGYQGPQLGTWVDD